MDLSFAPEEHAFALEVRSWLADNVEVPARFENIAEEVAFGRRWQSRLAESRWVGIHWPREYGGRGASPALSRTLAAQIPKKGLHDPGSAAIVLGL